MLRKNRVLKLAMLRRMGVLITLTGLSLFVGVLVRDSILLSSPLSSRVTIPPNAYHIVDFPSHYRTEEVEINVVTQNSSVMCLILINEYNLTDVTKHFLSQPTFTINNSKSIEFTTSYGITTLTLLNPTSSYETVQYTVRPKSYDYGAMTIATSLIIVGIATGSLSYIWTRKRLP